MRPYHLSAIGILLLCAVAGAASGEQCSPTDPTLLKPDLIAERPSHVQVLQRSGHRFVVFTTTIGNVGEGPLVLQGQTVDDPNNPTGPQVTQATQVIERTGGTPCTNVAGLFEYHPSHRHWHFDDFSEYLVRKDDPFTGPVVAKSEKVSFCLMDVKKLAGYKTPVTVVSNCLEPDGIQGIDVGYADVYDSFLPGQFVDLDADPAHPVPGGNYFLVNVANPNGVIWEMNNGLEANSGVISIRVPDPAGGSTTDPPPVTTPGDPPPPPVSRSPHTPHSPHTPGGGRPPQPVPASHQVHNHPGQPHSTVPSFPHAVHGAHHPAPPLHSAHPQHSAPPPL